ncbi:MAG: hypothetical protein MZV49_02360 [Rhodopseudomonas palustris]|nr:hypothetical protein [Rhodopseudomonas palustris]
MLPSVSYAPFDGTGHPDVDNIPTTEQIRSDLKTLAPMSKAIRLYSSTGGVELVPPIANEVGLKVTVGAWIDKNVDRNEREMQAAIELSKRNSNVNGIVVGNEAIYRGEQKVEDLIEADPARQGPGQCAGHDRRNLEYLDRAPRACVLGRPSSPRTSCRIGKAFRTSRRSIRR